MANDIKIDFKNINSRVKNLNEFSKVIVRCAEIVRGDLIGLWLSGKGGDGNQMKKLSKEYAAEKAASGRKPIPNLNYSGNLQASLRITEYKSESKAVIKPSGVDAKGNSNTKKMRGIVDYRSNAMAVGDNNSIMKKVLSRAYEYLKKVTSK